MSIPLSSDPLAIVDHKSRLEWRRHCRLVMAGLSEEQKRQQAQAMGTRLVQLAVESKVKLLAVYWPIHDEPNLLPVWQRLRDEGFELALPSVVARGEALSFSLWHTDAQLVANQWGISEVNQDVPVVALRSLEMIVMPCVGYWRTGHRLGYGGGFYDRTLDVWRGLPLIEGNKRIAIGLAYDECLLPESLLLLPTDQRCDFIITANHQFIR